MKIQIKIVTEFKSQTHIYGEKDPFLLPNVYKPTFLKEITFTEITCD